MKVVFELTDELFSYDVTCGKERYSGSKFPCTDAFMALANVIGLCRQHFDWKERHGETTPPVAHQEVDKKGEGEV